MSNLGCGEVEIFSGPVEDGLRERRAEATRLAAWDLTQHQLLDLELIANGGFAPLQGFLGEDDYRSVLTSMRLETGSLWPIPVTLDLDAALADRLAIGDRLALRHPEGMPLAVLTLESLFRPDKYEEAAAVVGTTDPAHPWVHHLLHEVGEIYAGGRLEILEKPPHALFRDLRLEPPALRDLFQRRGWQRVVAFQTRNPLHRAHFELVRRAAEEADAAILLHPVIGRTRAGDLDNISRVACYRAVLPRFSPRPILLSLLPLAMRMAGPREALWHALIRKNYGATHFIVGRDHASPGTDSAGRPFYDPYSAQRLTARHQAEIGIHILPFEELVHRRDLKLYVSRSEIPAGTPIDTLSGSELRQKLRQGQALPSHFTFREVENELRKRYPPRHQQGVVIFFTGLSGAGKSTIAGLLQALLEEQSERRTTLLDGDLVRRHLSSELGFSHQHRNLNVARIGFVATEIAKHGGIAICAPIAPFAAARDKIRQAVQEIGGFIEIHVATPLEVCEQRDAKGLYAKARAGLIQGFTGIDDPYEPPPNPELLIDTSREKAGDAATRILDFLHHEGYLAGPLPRVERNVYEPE